MGILSGYRHGDMWGHEDIEQQKDNAMLQGSYTEEAPLDNWSIFWALRPPHCSNTTNNK